MSSLNAAGSRCAEETGSVWGGTTAESNRGSFYVECHVCGYEPPMQLSLPLGLCPKCKSFAWQMIVRPHSLLDWYERRNADQRAHSAFLARLGATDLAGKTA